MPDITTALKAEIARVSRKTLRSEAVALRRAVKAHRVAIAVMKKRLDVLERQLKASKKAVVQATEGPGEERPSLRFRPDGLKKHRERLGLSAANAGKIMGVSALSVYHWESGKTRPRAQQLEAIAALRALGKREAHKRLESLA